MSECEMYMPSYIGVKIVKAIPVDLFSAREQYGVVIKNDGPDDSPGYLVEYDTGYRSWCPKQQFEEANRPCDAMTFGHAIEAMKKGKKVARAGWNGKGMYLYYVPANTYSTQTEVAKAELGESVDAGAYIAMKPANGPIVIGWLASQTDMLAEDWQIVE